MFRTRAAFFAAAIGILPAVGAWSQSATAHKIAITLTGVDCERASQVFVVSDGDDRRLLKAKRDADDPCRWGAEQKGIPFPIQRTRFSLRFRGARTGCRYAVEIPDEKDALEPVGHLEFVYAPKKANDLTIATEPDTLYLSYLRRFPEDRTDRASVECLEKNSAQGTATLIDVLLPREALSLNIGLAPNPRDADWVALDDSIRRMIIDDARRDEPTELTPEDLGTALVRDIARQHTEVVPRISGNEATAFAETLRKKGLKSFRVKAEP